MKAIVKQHEHEFEAAPGLPERLPENERILWQGAPDWRALAIQAMHVRAISAYFAILLVLRAYNVVAGGGTLSDALTAVFWLLPFAILAVSMLCLLAWLTSRTTVYTLTDRRVVMRIGIVLCITFNFPHKMTDSANLRTYANGTGDIALQLYQNERIAYVHLWPHARPWRVKRSEPMLRSIAGAQSVAALLADALANSSLTAAISLPVSALGDDAADLPLPTASRNAKQDGLHPMAA